MISATAPPGMPIERGMVASWIPETSQPGSREYDQIMGCSARNADRPVARAIKTKHAGLNASRQIKKNNINKLQATGGGPALSNKQQAKKVVDACCGTC